LCQKLLAVAPLCVFNGPMHEAYRPLLAARPSAALVWLFGRSTRAPALWLARLYAVLGALSTVGLIAWMARRYGADEASIAVAARGSGAIAAVAGGIAAYTLAQRGKAADEHAALALLADARGHGRSAVFVAEMIACTRQVAEVVFVPVALIAILVWAFVTGGRVERAGFAFAGLVTFGLVATVVLGVVTALCRSLAKTGGRIWLLAIVLLPWGLTDVVLGGYGNGWLSIPGWLEHAWRTSTILPK
jgi:hypothetical protein